MALIEYNGIFLYYMNMSTIHMWNEHTSGHFYTHKQSFTSSYGGFVRQMPLIFLANDHKID